MDFYKTKKIKVTTYADKLRDQSYKKYTRHMTDFDISILGILFRDGDEAPDHQAIAFREPMWENEYVNTTNRAVKLVNMASGFFIDERNTVRVNRANASGKLYSRKRLAYPKFTLTREIIAQGYAIDNRYPYSSNKKRRKYTYSVSIDFTKEYAKALEAGVEIQEHLSEENKQNREEVYEAWIRAKEWQKLKSKKSAEEWAEAREKRMIEFPVDLN